MPRIKKRLDTLLVDRGLASSRERAKAMVMAGEVRIDGLVADKPGRPVSPDDNITLKETSLPYVSRGGVKLAGAITAYSLSCTGWVCMDVGASTGGFTDCLLQHGAGRVFAIDVGYGQLAWKLRSDPRVVVIERTNIRYMPKETVSEPIDLIVVDVSFISLRLVVPAALPFLRPGGMMLTLVKPQFEVGKGKVGKGGVVKDPRLHEAVIAGLGETFRDMGLTAEPEMASPILGPKGNREFFLLLRRTT